MTCPCDNTKRRMPKCDAGTPPVLEIDGGETPVLFHTVNIPASVGDDTTIPPTPGAYRNTRVTYEANNASYLYDSDGIPQILATSEVSVLSVNGQTGNVVLTAADVGSQEKLTAGTSITISPQNVISAPPVDTVLDKTSPNPISNSAVATAIDTITTELDRTVVYDLEMASDANSVTFTEDKIDVVTGVTSQEVDVIPTASADTAGTITAAEFRSITASQERLDALENGSVAIADLSATPTQQELTTAWLNATDQEELINRASIYDITNSKVWTYYTNILLWEETPAGAISVNPFTNNTAGTILGSTTDGAISANADGTGSVSGWSALKQTVSEKANSADLATVATTGAYSDLIGAPSLATVATSGDYDDLIDKPTIGNATLTIQKNGTDVQTFTANATSDVTANISVPTDLSELSGKVTASQIDEEAITTDTISGSGTNISLNGTMDGAAIDDVKLKGDTEQQTYTGKNLLNIADGTYSHNGITATVVGGKVSLSGTASGTSFIRIPFNFAIAIGDSYTLSANNDFTIGSGSGTYAAIRLNYQNQTLEAMMNVTETSASNTYTTAYSITEFVIRTSSGLSYPIGATIYPQLEAGTSATSYEPYVGGTASPNPDYPQEVQTVTGEQTITVSNGQGESQVYPINLGKNLFDKSTITAGYYIDNSGNLVADSSNFVGDYIEIYPANSYVVSATTTNAKRIGYYDNTKTFISRQLSSSSSVVLAIPANARYVRLSCYNTDLDTLQIERGSTATSYAPYFTPIELCKIGDYQDYIYKSGEDWYVHKEVGKIASYGSESITTEYVSTTGQLTAGATVYYGLTTATDTQITNSALIAQLNALSSAQTYDGTTYITVSSENLAGSLEVTTAADSKLAPNSVYSSAIRDGAVTVDKIASLQALADALAPYLSNQ